MKRVAEWETWELRVRDFDSLSISVTLYLKYKFVIENFRSLHNEEKKQTNKQTNKERKRQSDGDKV